ncbi:MAG: 1-(5-phosphoribosyl)-5-[(5-phosphoribosylamino)methylideneamino]imidazole-4-carboxamide isomerase [Verrucomicrobiae bacterium]|nr:1-(5-phosphoribosyl)-5-[(5-phosphoribosylamino)methylideneamino]imidazole-4-carboxamide isomerase [Verrucomicrobiae bacterium]
MFAIPAIDLKDGKCVRLTQGRLDQMKVYSDNPVEMALRWESQGASVIHVVDLDGAFTGEAKNLDWVARICGAVKCKVQMGGGMRTREAVERSLGAGVKRVVLGTKALSEPFLDRMLASFGESIVVGIDARDGKAATQGWTQKTGVDAFEFARKVSAMGAMRIVFTDVMTDGMLAGPPLGSIGRICVAFGAGMVIASGGVKTSADVKAVRGLGHANLEGIIVGKALYEQTCVLSECE